MSSDNHKCHHLPWGFLFCLALLLPMDSLARNSEAETDSTKTGSSVLLPILGYTPDTGLMLGGMYLKFFYLEPDVPDSRPSTFSPVVMYTLKNQTMIFLGTTFNWDQSRNTLDFVPNYIRFPDQFYGIGRDVKLENEEDYTSERYGLDLEFNRKVWRDWRLGLSYVVMKHRLEEVDPAGQLAGGTITGTENTWLSGLGPTLALDSRDNTWAPDQGWWLQVSARFGGTALGSDYTIEEYNLDLRRYWTVGQNWVLAGQYLTTRIEGDAPFFVMPRLGGDSGLRGYRGGLYLDATRALLRFELRRSHLWGRMGAVVFAGAGDVAPTPAKLTLAGELWTTGFGLRYMVDEKERVNIRIDYGFGNGDSGFFLSLGEAF
jgi:outer membrane protein assembly factor BamA